MLAPFALKGFVRGGIRLYSTEKANQFIKKTVTENDLVVFMKGTPSKPACGFSKAVCQILELNRVPAFTAINVLEDTDIRSAVKTFSSWPTIPQVYIKGEFIGGCDIIVEMHKSGKLAEIVEKEILNKKEK